MGHNGILRARLNRAPGQPPGRRPRTRCCLLKRDASGDSVRGAPDSAIATTSAVERLGDGRVSAELPTNGGKRPARRAELTLSPIRSEIARQQHGKSVPGKPPRIIALQFSIHVAGGLAATGIRSAGSALFGSLFARLADATWNESGKRQAALARAMQQRLKN